MLDLRSFIHAAAGESSPQASNLHLALVALAKFAAPTPAQRALRNQVPKRIRALCSKEPRLQRQLQRVAIFGSSAPNTLLDTFASDVDVRIVLCNTHMQPASGALTTLPSIGSEREALLLVQTRLMKSGFAHKLEPKLSARKPILTFLDCVSGCMVDISVEGLGNKERPEPTLSRYTTLAGFREMLVLLKLISSQGGFDVPFLGGLGSFKTGVLLGEFMLQNVLPGDKGGAPDFKSTLHGFAQWVCSGQFVPRMHQVEIPSSNTTPSSQQRCEVDLVKFRGVKCLKVFQNALQAALSADNQINDQQCKIPRSNLLPTDVVSAVEEVLRCWLVVDPIVCARQKILELAFAQSKS